MVENMYDGMSRWMRRFKGELIGIQYDAGLRVAPLITAEGEVAETAATREWESEGGAVLPRNNPAAVKKGP